MKKFLLDKIKSREAIIGVIGLGYVGLPLILRYCETGYRVLGFDIDQDKVEKLNAGQSYIEHISLESLLSVEEKLKCKAFTSFPLILIFSFPIKVTFCFIILPEIALICALALTIS